METTATPAPTDLATLLVGLLREPGRPRVTWYGPGGERVELSGVVLLNWVNKTTNLLVEEFDAAPGARVRLDLPPHWRTLVWALATWRTGAGVLTSHDDGPADVVVTHRPDAHPDASDVVAVALPALARRFDGDLPPGALDAAGAVMTYGDALGWVAPADPAAAALTGTSHAGLLAATAGHDVAPGARVLHRVPDGPVTPDELVLELAVLAADGSLVLVAPGAGIDEGRVAESERVTALGALGARRDR